MSERDEAAPSCLSAIGALVLCLVMLVTGTTVEAFVLARLWLWFVVPGFHAAPLSAPAAFGVTLVASWGNSRSYVKQEYLEHQATRCLMELVVVPGFLLFTGFALRRLIDAGYLNFVAGV